MGKNKERREFDPEFDGLTPTQRTVDELSKEGMGVEEIASRLRMNPNAVRKHRQMASAIERSRDSIANWNNDW
jgi:DNA-binding NarL/FixJ family response regulator